MSPGSGRRNDRYVAAHVGRLTRLLAATHHIECLLADANVNIFAGEDGLKS